MYCTKCGQELREGSSFCSVCGAPVRPAGYGSALRRGQGPADDLGAALARGALAAGKMLAVTLGACTALGCILSALGLVAFGAYLLVGFARGASVALPWFIAQAMPTALLRGELLLVSGIASLIVAVVVIATAVVLIRALVALTRQRS